MVNKTLRSALRKMRKNLVLLIATGLLVAVGTGFFVTLFTISYRFEETAQIYFKDYHYADCTFYGNFTDTEVSAAREYSGITAAAGRHVKDYRDGEKLFRTISLTDGVNSLYVFEGALPQNAVECALNKNSAAAMGYGIGDTVTVDKRALKLTGTVASPEYIYPSKSERSPMTDSKIFGTVYVTADFFGGNYNEIVVLHPGEWAPAQLSAKIGAQSELAQSEQVNYQLYKDQNKKVQTFAYIFTSVFAVMIVAVVYVILKRIAVKERMQISIYKSLGASNKSILSIYLGQFLIVFLISALIGCAATVLVTKIILTIFARIFTLPLLGYYFYPSLWAFAFLAAALLCLIPGTLSLVSVLRKKPAEVMRPPESQKTGKKILAERMGFLWKRLSFNSRYTLKTMLRSKGRFFAIVAGITATVALIVLSFGFYNSILNIQDAYFDNFARYDMTVSFDYNPLPLEAELPFSAALPQDAAYGKVLQGKVRIKEDIYMITVVEEGFRQLNLDMSMLDSGIIIPKFQADQWNVKTGDMLNVGISMPDFPSVSLRFKIGGVVEQTMAIGVYVTYDYLVSVFPPVPKLYNAVYLSAGDLSGLTSYLNENNFNYSTAADDRKSFTSVTDSITILIFFMIICALILGVAVLYSVGLINLNSREGEYMLMQTLGYRHSKIMRTHVKEAAMQIILALPLGYLLGFILLFAIKNAFSGTTIVLAAVIYPLTYLLAALIVGFIAFLMALVTSRHIRRLDIVEGLKSQE